MSAVFRAIGLLPLLAATAYPTLAQDMSTAVLAASCYSCHGPSGASPREIPSLDGLDAAAMSAKLNGFKDGTVEATVMNRIAKGFSEDEIASLVQYLTAK